MSYRKQTLGDKQINIKSIEHVPYKLCENGNLHTHLGQRVIKREHSRSAWRQQSAIYCDSSRPISETVGTPRNAFTTNPLRSVTIVQGIDSVFNRRRMDVITASRSSPAIVASISYAGCSRSTKGAQFIRRLDRVNGHSVERNLIAESFRNTAQLRLQSMTGFAPDSRSRE